MWRKSKEIKKDKLIQLLFTNYNKFSKDGALVYANCEMISYHKKCFAIIFNEYSSLFLVEWEQMKQEKKNT